jgi:hypothetical protein
MDEKKVNHIDKESIRILELFEESDDDVQPTKDPSFGSIVHQDTVDMTDHLADEPILTSSTILGKTISLKECYNGKCIGLNETNYQEFQKFLNVIYKDKEINFKVSRKFIEHKSLQWLLNTYKQKRIATSFSSHIIDEIENSIGSFKVHYMMLYLDIGKPF